MSQAQLEKKVHDYLRNSQALADYWRRPITAEQLQSEMDRMAKHTKQPEVLRELFGALGNDPFVIAEFLARPLLTERLTADLSGQNRTKPVESTQTRALPSMSVATMSTNGAHILPKIPEATPPCTDDTWTATSTINAPFARTGHTAVWTGGEMIVWGGSSGFPVWNTGGRYNPATNSWMDTSTTNAPSARYGHTAVWTGSEMIVWGGDDGTYSNTGGRYNPATDSWTPTSATNAPSGRVSHTAVWIGSEMIVWGGYNGSELDTGGRYNPSTDSWMATSTTNAPSARDLHTAVWTTSEMIVWGGCANCNYGSGGRYDAESAPAPTPTPSEPPPTATPTATPTVPPVPGTGGRYDPATDSWRATSSTNAPVERSGHTAVWNGSEMIVWGGVAPGSFFDTGGRYCAQLSATPTATPTATASPTATPTPTATLTPRPTPAPRVRPTPAPRP